MKTALVVLFYIGFVIGLWAGFLGLLSKRDDVSSIDFLLAGPAILLFPERYLKAERLRLFKILSRVVMLLFALVWIGSWCYDNL